MKKNNVYVFEDRGLLYLNGEDVKEFLQNLITNDIEKVTDEMSCFAALLTPVSYTHLTLPTKRIV